MTVSGVGGRIALRFLVIIMYLHFVGLRFSREEEMQSARALTSFCMKVQIVTTTADGTI